MDNIKQSQHVRCPICRVPLGPKDKVEWCTKDHCPHTENWNQQVYLHKLRESKS